MSKTVDSTRKVGLSSDTLNSVNALFIVPAGKMVLYHAGVHFISFLKAASAIPYMPYIIQNTPKPNIKRATSMQAALRASAAEWVRNVPLLYFGKCVVEAVDKAIRAVLDWPIGPS